LRGSPRSVVSNARVLVVDDEAGVRTASVEPHGRRTGRGHGGRRPHRPAAALTGSFDLILLDIIIPGLSGYRVLEQLRNEGVDTPVLLISAKDGEVDQADGLDLGADGYLVKPFSFMVLVAQVKALLRRRDASRPVRGGRLRLGELIGGPATKTGQLVGRPVEAQPRESPCLRAGQPAGHGAEQG